MITIISIKMAEFVYFPFRQRGASSPSARSQRPHRPCQARAFFHVCTHLYYMSEPSIEKLKCFASV